MLSYEHFHKQVKYYKTLCPDKLPCRVYAYIRNEQKTKAQMVLIPAADFHKYCFVEYTYAGSFYPVIQPLNQDHV